MHDCGTLAGLLQQHVKDPNIIGRLFQDEVGGILRDFAGQHPNHVSVEAQKEIRLTFNGIVEPVKPDFHVSIYEPPECRHYLLECQNRNRTSQSIEDKNAESQKPISLDDFLFRLSR